MGVTESLENLLRFLPEIIRPERRVSLREKMFWTGLALIIYLVMTQIPLYGIPWRASQYEQIFFLQIVLASKRGTLMELGIGPIVTSGLIWQLLVGSKVINIDLSTPKGRALFTGLEKLFAIIFTIVEALAYIVGGAYGRLPLATATIVFLQLVSATLIIMLLDEMLQKGWGLGSGISLFIAAGVAQQIFWEMLSPFGPLADGLYYGAIPAFVYAVVNATSSGNWTIVREALIRPSGWPSMLGLIFTILIFIILVYLESMQVEIPISISRYRGIRAKIPFKFLYVSNIPIILVSALLADFHIFAQIAWNNLNPHNENPWFNFIAMYNVTQRGYVPLPGSLAYYLTPPRSISSIFEDPIRVLVYSALFILFSVLFSIAWIEASGMDAWSQAKQLAEAGMQIPGFRKAPKVMAAILNKYIPTLAILSGLIVGIIAIISDLVGVLGSGIGILLLVGILIQYQALLAREQAMEMYPMLGKLLGT